MDRFFKRRFNRANAGVGFVLVIAAVIVILTLLPPTVSPPTNDNCIVGEAPASEQSLVLPAIKDMYVPPDFSSNDPIYGGMDPNEKAEFVLIRQNVPTAKESIPENWVFLGGTEKKDTEHTINMKEFPEKPGYDAYYPSRWGEIDLVSGQRIWIRNEGILVMVNNDPELVRVKDGKHIYLADVYQDKRILDNPEKKYSTEELFLCFPDSELDAPSLTIPEQSNSPDQEQLQLQWIYLQSKNYWGVHCKPAVYLYPPKKTVVNVKVHPAGFLTYTDPLYDPEKGWTVTAEPNGAITNMTANNFMKNYDYLYFESKVRDEVIEKPTEGWVIKSGEQNGEWFNNQEVLFRNILPKLGLNSAQEKDFIEYWKKALPYSPYYFIGIIDPENVDDIEGLEIDPKPDSINRVRIYFERLEEPRDVITPIIENNPFMLNDNQFKVVEWGGMVKNDLDHPFTCSQ